MASSIIAFDHVTLRRRGAIVLSQVTFSVEPGEILVVIGPSGSGKSSILRCINRLEAIESGQIRFKDLDIAQQPILQLRREIGMVFQKSAAFEGTVAENIAYGPELRGERLSRDTIKDLMTQAALEPDLIDQNAQTLSGGQEQRMAIARALANTPKLLLLDEPTSALDPIATRTIEDVLLHLRDTTDLTLIWVSHSVEQARRVADWVLLLEDGAVSRLAPAKDLLDAEHGDSHALAFTQGIDDTAKTENNSDS